MNQVGDNHHYVPRALLRNFASKKRNNYFIYAFDKLEERVFRSNIKNVASEHGFYDLNSNEGIRSFEPGFSGIENGFRAALDQIIRTKNLSALSEEQRQVVACFAAVQKVRTRQHREMQKEVFAQLKEAILSRFGEEEYPPDWPQMYTHEQAKTDSILNLGESVFKLLPYFLDKAWILFEADQNHLLYISDHPVVLQNTINQDQIRGTLGVGVKGIEIYLPLSSELCLCFLCPSAKALLKKHGYHSQSKLNGDEPIALKPEEVKNLNHLQVMFSSQYVFCEKPEFALVQEMIASDPASKSMLKPVVS